VRKPYAAEELASAFLEVLGRDEGEA